MQQILCSMNGILTSFGHGVSNFASSERQNGNVPKRLTPTIFTLQN